MAEQEQSTVAFVQEWMMSGDHEPDLWTKDFAIAIDARTPTPAAVNADKAVADQDHDDKLWQVLDDVQRALGKGINGRTLAISALRTHFPAPSKAVSDMAAALRNTPAQALREAGYLDRAADMLEQAATPAPDKALASVPQGTFACPICGKDTPHYHSPDEVREHQETEAWVEESWQKAKTLFFPPAPDNALMPEAAVGELERGKDELRRLMDSIWRAEYRKEAPNWQPLDDLPGMISQIDNMYAGVREQRDQARWHLHNPAATNAGQVEAALREVEAMCGQMQADAANLSTIPDEQRGIHNAAWNLSVGVRAMITALKANGDAS